MDAPRLSPDQAEAWDRIADLMSESGVDLTDGMAAPRDDDESRVLAVTGKAGSGKTLLLAQMVKSMRAAGCDIVSGDYERKRRDRRTLAVLAPTNKAASVLRTRGVPATTIHRILYTPVYDPEYERIAEWLSGDADRPETEALTPDMLDRAKRVYDQTSSVPGALAAAGLAILPDTAQAMGGEGAKQSFFGAKSISNPFTYNEKSKGPIVYKVRWVLLWGELRTRASSTSLHGLSRVTLWCLC